MNSTRHFNNEKLKDRSTYLAWHLALVAGLVGCQLLFPIIRPNRYSGSTTEWIFTLCIIIIVTIYFITHRRFVSITFDDLNGKITLTTMNVARGKKTDNYKYADITFNDGKDPARFRKKATEFIEIYNRNQKVIKLEKTSIGDYSFNKIVSEFQLIKPPV